MVGLRTVQLSQKLEQQILIRSLTHRDDIRVCVVHSNIVFLCPLQADFRPGPENLIVAPEAFQSRHELLKTGDCTR